MKIFFHVSAMKEGWKNIFNELYDDLNTSGLLKQVKNNLFIGFVGEVKDFEYVKSKVAEGVEVKNFGNDFKRYEFPTLEELDDYSQAVDDVVLYIHTKGVSKPSSISKKYWRRAMSKFLIHDWKVCDEYLKRNELVGYNVKGENNPKLFHFSGNFWYAHTKFIRQCKPIRYLQTNPQKINDGLTDVRFQAEFWLKTGLNSRTKFKSVGTSDFENEYKIHPCVTLDNSSIDVFDKIGLKVDRRYIINLDKEVKRKESSVIQCKFNGVSNVVVYPAFNSREKKVSSSGKNNGGMVGCWVSHEAVLTEAYVNNYDNILVMEDDIKFEYGFHELFSEAWKSVPADWDFLWFGPYEKSGSPKRVSGRVHIPKDCWGTHAYLVSKSGIKKVVEALKATKSIIDIDIFIHKHIPGLKQYSFYPSLVKQAGFKSTIRG